jgi:hypothetical protein
MSKNVMDLDGPQLALWRHVACRIIKSTRAQTHTRARVRTPPHVRTYIHPCARAHTHRQKYVILFFHVNRCFGNAPYCYVIVHCVLFLYLVHQMVLLRHRSSCRNGRDYAGPVTPCNLVPWHIKNAAQDTHRSSRCAVGRQLHVRACVSLA